MTESKWIPMNVFEELVDALHQSRTATDVAATAVELTAQKLIDRVLGFQDMSDAEVLEEVRDWLLRMPSPSESQSAALSYKELIRTAFRDAPLDWSAGVPIVESDTVAIVQMGLGLRRALESTDGSEDAEEKLGAAIQKLKRLGFTDAQAKKALLDGTALPYLQHDESLPFSPTGVPITKL